MRVYFDKEGLIESQEFYIDKKAPYSLFLSVSTVYPFVKFEEELANINDYCFFILKVLDNELVYLNKVRKIRNQFVHRAWEQVEERCDKFRLCDVFNVTSKFFTEIEKAACSEGIIEENRFLQNDKHCH